MTSNGKHELDKPSFGVLGPSPTPRSTTYMGMGESFVFIDQFFPRKSGWCLELQRESTNTRLQADIRFSLLGATVRSMLPRTRSEQTVARAKDWTNLDCWPQIIRRELYVVESSTMRQRQSCQCCGTGAFSMDEQLVSANDNAIWSLLCSY